MRTSRSPITSVVDGRAQGDEMRRVRYQVACSLDGYIAGPNDETDWITGGDDIDFEELFSQFDTLVMGRRTFEKLPRGPAEYPGKQIIVASRTLGAVDHESVEVVASDIAGRIRELRKAPGKDIWLFGGGVLFRSLLEAGEVDTIEP